MAIAHESFKELILEIIQVVSKPFESKNLLTFIVLASLCFRHCFLFIQTERPQKENL